jgi:hypothetical protein
MVRAERAQQRMQAAQRAVDAAEQSLCHSLRQSFFGLVLFIKKRDSGRESFSTSTNVIFENFEVVVWLVDMLAEPLVTTL